jgi:hypothetical protein
MHRPQSVQISFGNWSQHLVLRYLQSRTVAPSILDAALIEPDLMGEG